MSDVNHKTISDLNDLQDRITAWIRHHRQPRAYFEPADDLVDLVRRMVKITEDHNLGVSTTEA